MSQINGILAMNPEKYREIDGVVFDLDSYARHCAPQDDTPSPPQPAQETKSPPLAPAPVFAVEPQHRGWYPTENGQPPVPVMAGAIPPDDIFHTGDGQPVITRMILSPAGSGSGSGSYVTSYRTSWISSGSYLFSSGVWVGGYGLELI